MNIKVFAGLKDFFDESQEVNDLKTVEDVKKYLALLNPEALSVLDKCRFAIKDSFVPLNTTIAQDEIIYVMPPSSGG